MPNTVLWRGATAAQTSRVRGRSVNGDAQSAVLASRTSCHEPRLTRTRRRTAPRRQGCRSHGTVLVDGDDHVHRHGEVGTRGLRHRISCGDAAGARDRRCRMRAQGAAGLLACCLEQPREGLVGLDLLSRVAVLPSGGLVRLPIFGLVGLSRRFWCSFPLLSSAWLISTPSTLALSEALTSTPAYLARG